MNTVSTWYSVTSCYSPTVLNLNLVTEYATQNATNLQITEKAILRQTDSSVKLKQYPSEEHRNQRAV